MQGGYVRAFYRKQIAAVLEDGEPTRLVTRCDSPAARRELRLAVSSIFSSGEPSGILFQALTREHLSGLNPRSTTREVDRPTCGSVTGFVPLALTVTIQTALLSEQTGVFVSAPLRRACTAPEIASPAFAWLGKSEKGPFCRGVWGR